ncbi:MAG: hypothetical protein II393_00815 [Cytophagales bacterium]|nr:hypothetical protein [Cytophagales bacterium]
MVGGEQLALGGAGSLSCYYELGSGNYLYDGVFFIIAYQRYNTQTMRHKIIAVEE